jgi:hypothetical protein
MEDTYGERLARPDTPEFASYATLRRGLGFERELAEWCGWLADALERAPAVAHTAEYTGTSGIDVVPRDAPE